MLAVALLLGSMALKLEAPTIIDDDEQSKTGPEPPKVVAERDAEKAREVVPLAVTVTEVQLPMPGYLWRHGCGPTAVGMVVGYYDTLGYSDLVPGDASTQTSDVDQAIASGGDFSNPNPPGFEEHYEDYSRPEDHRPDLLTDDYITQGRTPHIDNCIADYMDTSKSTRNNYYGWSRASDIKPSFTNYVNLKNNLYDPNCQGCRISNGTLTWDVLTGEIDNGTPMVFLVDCDGDDDTDHFVTVVGYRDRTNQQYGCLDTWPPAEKVRWENFQQMADGIFWGISHGWSFSLGPIPGDLDVDGVVDFNDLEILVRHWLDDSSYPKQGLVGYWKLDEGRGTIATDSSGNDNDGTLNGDPNWVTGKVGGYALDFDGDGDYVNVPDNNTGLDIDSNMTIAAWVKLNSVGPHLFYIVTKQPSGTAGDNYPGNYEFKIQFPSWHLNLSHQSSTGQVCSGYKSTSAVGFGQWYHVAVTLVEGGNVNFYIDGVPVGTSSQYGTFGILNDEPVRIGARKDANYWFNGIIDEVAIYNRALSASEIREYCWVDLNRDGEINFLDFAVFANNWLAGAE